MLSMMLFFTGCGLTEEVVIDKNNKATVTVAYLFTEEEYNAMKENATENFDDGILGTVTIDGILYYKLGETEKTTAKALCDNNIEISANGFYADSSIKDAETNPNKENNANKDFTMDTSELDKQLEEIRPVQLVFTFPSEITKTNGQLSEDKKTVTFIQDNKNTEFYAYTDKFKATKKAEIEGYKTTKINYVKAKKKKIQINSLYGFKKINIDKKAVSVGKKTKTKKVTLQEGKHNIELTAPTGKTNYKIYVDGTAPKVTGVANNKTYKKAVTIKFSDKVSGVKKATLNGKTIKTNKKVVKKGSYTLVVVDKAGNKKTVKFKIKK